MTQPKPRRQTDDFTIVNADSLEYLKPKKKAQSARQKPSTGHLTALDAAQVAMEALARKKAPTAHTAPPLFDTEETDNA